MSDKAQRAEILIGPHTVEGFMLPDGSYQMSLTQVAEVIGLTARNAFDFLRSKSIKALLGEGYTVSISEIEPDVDQTTGGSRIRGLPLEVAGTYWVWQAYRGNKSALALCVAMVTESLERRFDAAFGVSRTESEYNQRLIERNAELEHALRVIGAGLELEDAVYQENEYLKQVLRDNGIDPWALQPYGEGDLTEG